jgi:hypothetical protein
MAAKAALRPFQTFARSSGSEAILMWVDSFCRQISCTRSNSSSTSALTPSSSTTSAAGQPSV